MEKSKPSVSVIVRTKDRPKLLKRAFQSIASQTYRPIEVVLVNDGGCDLDMDELKGVLGDISLNYQRLEKNMGRAHAGNVGIENAKGEYVGFLDDDDEFYPGHIETLTRFLQESDYKIAYTDAEIIRSHYDPAQKHFVDINEGVYFSEDYSPHTLLFENYIPLICLLIHKSVLERIGLFDEGFELFEDWDLLIRISRAYSFQHIALTTAKYYQWSRDSQIAHSDATLARERYLDVLKKHEAQRTSMVAYQYFLKKQEQIVNRNLRIRDLTEPEREMQKKDYELARIKGAFDQKEIEFRQACEKLQETESKLVELEKTLEEFGNVKENLAQVREELLVKNAYIEEVRASIGWTILEWYRRRIKSFVAPLGSRRWQVYHKLLKGIRTVKKDGFRVLIGKAARQFREVKASASIITEQFKTPDMRSAIVEFLDVKISVVIPTKNAGPEFRQVLEKITTQKGVGLEIIVVDSGSTDNTIEMARRFGAKIISIDPSEFGHGRTRNLGARHATGEFIIFLSQDAIPIGDICFANMIRGMKNDVKIAAVSAKQIARSDADFFACWQIWNHYENFLRHSGDEVVSSPGNLLDELSPADRRRISQIDNICSCIRRDVFVNYEFSDLPYAEDLDLGLRLSADGYKIGFLSSVGVIHSHSRGAAYYFKRSFIDRKAQIRLLSIEPVNWSVVGIRDLPEILDYIRSTYRKLSASFGGLDLAGLQEKGDRIPLTAMVQERLGASLAGNNNHGDSSLEKVLQDLVMMYGIPASPIVATPDVLMEQFYSILYSFNDFLAGRQFSDLDAKNIFLSLHSIAGVILGANLGDFSESHQSTGDVASPIGAIFGNCV